MGKLKGRQRARKKKKSHDKNSPQVSVSDEPIELKEASSEEKLKEDLAEEKKKYMYLVAEMENFRKQVAKEKTELLKFGQKSTILEVLKVIDIFQKALDMEVNESSWKNFHQGVLMIRGELSKSLSGLGVEEVSVASGEKFNPEIHEAVSTENHDEIAKDHIIKVFCQPYKMHGRVIRPGQVVVSSGTPPSPSSS